MAWETITASSMMFVDDAEAQRSVKHTSAFDCMPVKGREVASVDSDAEDAQSTQASEGVDNHHDEDRDHEQVVEKLGAEASMPRRKLWADLVDTDDEDVLQDAPFIAQSKAEKNSKHFKSLPACDKDKKSSWEEKTRASKADEFGENESYRSNRQKATTKEPWASNLAGECSQWKTKKNTRRQTASQAIDEGADNSCRHVADTNSGKHAEKAYGKGQSKGADNRFKHVAGANSGKNAEKAYGKGQSKGADNRHQPVADMSSGKRAEKAYGKGQSMTGKRSHAQAKEVSRPAGRNHEKMQCQFTIGIEEDNKFRVVRRILGSGGQNMKKIAEATGVKLRLRGRGSKFLEGPEQQESLDDLMLCISSQDEEGYQACLPRVQKILERIYREYETFCKNAGREVPRPKIQLHEGPRQDSY